MATLELEKKARFVTDKNGKPVEVILSYSVYKRFLELETSMEIFKRKETQKSIKKTKEDINKRRFKIFNNSNQALSHFIL